MEKVKLTIHVVPENCPISDLADVNERQTGSTFSTPEFVRISRVEDGYAILYTDSAFAQLNALDAINYIIGLITSKLPGTQIEIGLEYHFELENGAELVDDDAANNVLDMDDILIEIDDSTPIIAYERSATVDEVVGMFSDPDDEDEDEDDDYDPRDFDPEDIGGLVNLIAQEGSRSKKNKGKKGKQKIYGESRVLHETKNAKRCYNRHGVMVCSDKSALKHDQKMIKQFLKDFVPGNAEWKKDFRRDLQKRWMQMYVISKKQLKHLQKKHSKSKRKKRRGIDTEKALDFTRRVFNVPASNSAWNDPNR